MPEGMNQPAMPGGKRPRLAIVSSWNENCGNASYTYALKKEYERYYDVEVIGLDLFILQRSGPTFRRLGDRHIERIAEQLKTFDYVDIQFESGLYGANIRQVRARILKLIDAAPNLILTMHRLDMMQTTTIGDIYRGFLRLSLQPLLRARSRNAHARMYREIVRHCAKRAKRKNLWIKVHTKREKRLIAEAFDFSNCIDYPLCFLNDRDRRTVQSRVAPDELKTRYSLPPDAKTIGAFGYVSDYKGFETLIRTVSVLPENWHLLVVGSQHPQSIQAWTALDPYLATLIREIESFGAEGAAPLDKRLRSQVRFKADVSDIETVRHAAQALMRRVRFIGNVDDDDFTFMMRNVDAAVLPYLEVGQSMSGVIALAIESGARLFCSNTLSFHEVRRYLGQVYGTFDIGNYIEIAQKVQHDTTAYDKQRAAAYERYNIAAGIALHRHVLEHRALPSPAVFPRATVEVGE
jgi:glycosyltransferase involved in cell wall biosynthesis